MVERKFNRFEQPATMQDRLRYKALLPTVVDRQNLEPETYIPARIEVYLLQAKLGIRPMQEARSKIDKFLDRVSKRYPEIYEGLIASNEKGQKPLTEISNRVFPPVR